MTVPPTPLGGTLARPADAGGLAPAGVRIVLDARPIQEPDRSPLTAAYLRGLLGAFDAAPLAGESFALLLRSDLDDPTVAFPDLDVVGRRLLPPTHLLRSAALTIDPLVLSGASIGAAWRATAAGAAGAVYHAVGASVPLLTGLPVVVTLLDLAPWELARFYQRTATIRFGQRLRGRLLRDAAAVIVGSDAVAGATRKLLHVRRDRIRVIPFAPRAAFRFWPTGGPPTVVAGGRARADTRAERERLGLPERYLVYSGRYDARQDLTTLLHALELLGRAGRPAELAEDVPWPPRVLLVDASPGDRASLARAAARVDVGDSLAYAPRLSDDRVAALVRGARAAILPAVSDAMGLPAIEAISCGTPVVASAVGPLPEIVGTAGILVEPRNPERLASALATVWSDDRVHDGLFAMARDRAETNTWTAADAALATRRVYTEAATARR